MQKDWPLWAIIATQLGILIGVIALWQVAADRGWIDGFFWSKPSAIYATLITFFTDGDAFIDIGFTFRSTIIGFLIGTAAGSLLGLSFWWSRNYAAIAQPFVICFESLPKLALAPLVILVFGMGLASKVAIATALTLVVSTLTAYAGVKAVDPDQERLFYSLGASRLQVFRKLIVPFCLPWIISVLRVNIGLALTGAIVGEFIASQHGLGRQILYAGQTYDIASGLGRGARALDARRRHVCDGVLDRERCCAKASSNSNRNTGVAVMDSDKRRGTRHWNRRQVARHRARRRRRRHRRAR